MKKTSAFLIVSLTLTMAASAQFNPPTNLILSVGGGFPPVPGLIQLNWTQPEHGGTGDLLGYVVYRNEDSIAFAYANFFSETDPPLDSNDCVCYKVSAAYENPAGESPTTDTVCYCESSTGIARQNNQDLIWLVGEDYLHLLNASHETLVQVQLFTINGQIVFSGKLMNQRIIRPKSGIYIMRLTSQSGIMNRLIAIP